MLLVLILLWCSLAVSPMAYAMRGQDSGGKGEAEADQPQAPEFDLEATVSCLVAVQHDQAAISSILAPLTPDMITELQYSLQENGAPHLVSVLQGYLEQHQGHPDQPAQAHENFYRQVQKLRDSANNPLELESVLNALRIPQKSIFIRYFTAPHIEHHPCDALLVKNLRIALCTDLLFYVFNQPELRCVTAKLLLPHISPTNAAKLWTYFSQKEIKPHVLNFLRHNAPVAKGQEPTTATMLVILLLLPAPVIDEAQKIFTSMMPNDFKANLFHFYLLDTYRKDSELPVEVQKGYADLLEAINVKIRELHPNFDEVSEEFGTFYQVLADNEVEIVADFMQNPNIGNNRDLLTFCRQSIAFPKIVATLDAHRAHLQQEGK